MLVKFLGVGSGEKPFPGKNIYIEHTHRKPESDISQAAQHGGLLPVQKDIISDLHSTCVPNNQYIRSHDGHWSAMRASYISDS